MHPKLTDEASHILTIVQKGNSLRAPVHAWLLTEAPGEIAMPHLPVMYVTIFRAVVVIPPIGTSGPVRGVPIKLFDGLTEKRVDIMRARYRLVRSFPIYLFVTPLVLIVATPQRQAWMVTQSARLVTSFRLYLLDKAG